MIDFQLKGGARRKRALLHGAEMDKEIAGLLLRIGDAKARALAGQDAAIADLAAGLGVKRRLVQNDRAALALGEAPDFVAILHQRADDALGIFGLVAEKFGGAEFFA